MKVKELENSQNKSGLKDCKWSSLNASGTETPQSYPYWEREILPTPNKDETEGFQCLRHSNWIVCSPLSPFCSEKFPTFSVSYWGANSYYPRGLIMEKGISPNSQYGWDWGVSVPGAFKLDHLQPFKPILFWNFSNFFTFILGSPFFYPRGLIMRKGNYISTGRKYIFPLLSC